MIHIECKPDEQLVIALRFKRKNIQHHKVKSRIFKVLSRSKNQLAIVDEDPGSNKTAYENSLNHIGMYEGINCFKDSSGNKIFVLKGKLEDWIINNAKEQHIDLTDFGLPDNPDALHGEINHHLPEFKELLEKLLQKKNPAIMKLKSLLSGRN